MASLIDTDWFIDWIARKPGALALISPLQDAGIAISIISYIEVYQGLLRIDGAERAAAERILNEIEILDLSLPIARRCAEIREALKLAGKKPQRRSMDLIIAATAIEHGLTLVTRNTDDYGDIPGIMLHTMP